MYEEYYGLSGDPFRLTPDAQLSFQHKGFKKAKSYMRYALHRGEGIVLITGKPGTGKTTLIAELVSKLHGSKVLLTKITCNQLDGDDLLRMYASKLGVEVGEASNSVVLNTIESCLLELVNREHWPVLILDEAQTLTVSALEQVRMLTNFQMNNQPMMQVFLVGQGELRQRVLSPQLEQLHQRIVASCQLQPLSLDDTIAYVYHRLEAVGWQNERPTIDEGVCELIYRGSGGIPRWINLVGSRLLLHGMVEERNHLGTEDVIKVLEDLIAEDLLPAEVRENSLGALQLESDDG